MMMFLVKTSEDVSDSFAYKLGYGVGYVGNNYFWEVLIAFMLIIVGAVYLFIRQRRKRTEDI